MPELPEVENIRLWLEKVLPGQKISSFQVLSPKQFLTPPSKIEKIKGQEIEKLTRYGKNLFIHFKNKKILHVHLKMTGQLIFKTKKELSNQGPKPDFSYPHPVWQAFWLPNRYTRLIIKFKSGDKLFFNDLRRFGWFKLIGPSSYRKVQGSLGPDLFHPSFTLSYLSQILSSSSRPIKFLLLDQKKLSGLGNIYVNEVLFQSGIHPSFPASALKKGQVNKLYRSIKNVVKSAIKLKGSSAADEAYILPNGEKGQYQKKAFVYHRAGKNCQKCSEIIKGYKMGGRGTFFCPHCQPRPPLA